MFLIRPYAVFERMVPYLCRIHLRVGTLVAPLKMHSIALSHLQFLCGLVGERTSGSQVMDLLLQSICFKGQGSNSQLTGNGIEDISPRQVFRHKEVELTDGSDNPAALPLLP